MMTHPDAPLTAASLSRGRSGPVVLLEVRCPHCGKTHTHGGGRALEGARQYLGHRAGHCAPKVRGENYGYILTDPDGLLP